MKINYQKKAGQPGSLLNRIASRSRRGVFLIEATLSVVLMLAISLIVFRVTVTTIRARQWGIVQNLADSYLTFEVAYSSRIPFEDFNVVGGPFPVANAFDSEVVDIGTLPGGTAITGTIYRSRIEDADNATNVLEGETWKLRSILIYDFDGRTYAKSRTVSRTR